MHPSSSGCTYVVKALGLGLQRGPAFDHLDAHIKGGGGVTGRVLARSVGDALMLCALSSLCALRGLVFLGPRLSLPCLLSPHLSLSLSLPLYLSHSRFSRSILPMPPPRRSWPSSGRSRCREGRGGRGEEMESKEREGGRGRQAGRRTTAVL